MAVITTPSVTSISPEDVQSPPTDPAAYAAWKEQLINPDSGNTGTEKMLTAAAVTPGAVGNEFIEYALSPSGLFSIGTTGGNPDNPNDDNKIMLFGHPSPRTSYTTVYLDGTPIKLASTSSGSTTMLSSNGVEITQELSFVKSNTTQRDDVAQIKYTAKNTGTTAHSLGLRIMLDTMLGNNDSAPFRVPGIGPVTTETELSGANVPEYWQAFDNLLNPTVISQGYLGNGAGKPDTIQFTNWGRVFSQSWGYTVQPGQSNGDSAVSMIWNPANLAPGETRTYTTGYGLSDLNEDLRPPLAMSISSATKLDIQGTEYSPNPFTVSAYVLNNSGAAAKNVHIQIALPDGLVLSEGNAEQTLGDMLNSQEKQLTWKVTAAHTPVDKTLTYQVKVWADNAPEKIISQSVQVPALASGPIVYKLSEEGKDYYLVGFGPTQKSSSAVSTLGDMQLSEASDISVASADSVEAESADSMSAEAVAPSITDQQQFAVVTEKGSTNGEVYAYVGGKTPWKDAKQALSVAGTAAAPMRALSATAAATTTGLFAMPTNFQIKPMDVDGFRNEVVQQVKGQLAKSGIQVPAEKEAAIKLGVYHGVDMYGFQRLESIVGKVKMTDNEKDAYYLFARHMSGLAITAWFSALQYNTADAAYDQLKAKKWLTNAGYMTVDKMLGTGKGSEYDQASFHYMAEIGKRLGLNSFNPKVVDTNLKWCQQDYNKLLKLKSQWVCAVPAGGTWYKAIIKNKDGKNADLYVKVPTGELTETVAVVKVNGQQKAKEYRYASGTWSETGIYYAGGPVDGSVLVSSASIEPGMTAMTYASANDGLSDKVTQIITIELIKAAMQVQGKMPVLPKISLVGTIAEKQRMRMLGVSYSIDDNFFIGMIKNITGGREEIDDKSPTAYYYYEAKTYTDAACMAAFVKSMAGSAIAGWQKLISMGAQDPFLSASGGSIAISGAQNIENSASAVQFAGNAGICNFLMSTAFGNMKESLDKKNETEEICRAAEKKQFYDNLNTKDKITRNDLEHIFEGDPTNATGFHYEGVPGSRGKVVEITKQPNSQGVYEADVMIDGKPKAVPSTFFPKDWPPQRVVDSILKAMGDAKPTAPGTYIGNSGWGFKIQFYYDGKTILTAFPVYKP